MSPRGAPALPALAVWLEETSRWVEAELEGCLGGLAGAPPTLVEALRYALLGGGKRLRPALARLTCRWFGGTDGDARAPALALELVHTYSLVHDDLPCMDDDELRRGRPTCHVVYGEALAVLVGDALQTLAFGQHGDELARPRAAGELVAVLAGAAGAVGMVGGQVLDVAPPGVPPGAAGSASIEDVRRIHALKTAALFAAAGEMGAVAAGAPRADRRRAGAFGRALGLAFQAVDDVLDETGDAPTLGKTPGKDRALERSTLVAALGLKQARTEARRLAGEAEDGARALGAREGELPLELVRYVLGRRT